jgi:phosphoglycerate dehydrogenase-like enzyme
MTICNARGVHDDSTAELALTLAISSRRGFSHFNEGHTVGEWRHTRFPAFSDSSVGVIGNGSIAKRFSELIAPFNLEVKHFSRSASQGSISISELDSYLPQFDIVVIIVPLNDETRNMFNTRRLALMKDGATLVNVARGGIVDTTALINELNSGRLFAGLDVTSPEPLPADHPLWKAKNCIISPHVGGDSTAFEKRGKTLVEAQLQRLARGEDLINIVAQP